MALEVVFEAEVVDGACLDVVEEVVPVVGLVVLAFDWCGILVFWPGRRRICGWLRPTGRRLILKGWAGAVNGALIWRAEQMDRPKSRPSSMHDLRPGKLGGGC